MQHPGTGPSGSQKLHSGLPYTSGRASSTWSIFQVFLRCINKESRAARTPTCAHKGHQHRTSRGTCYTQHHPIRHKPQEKLSSFFLSGQCPCPFPQSLLFLVLTSTELPVETGISLRILALPPTRAFTSSPRFSQTSFNKR